MKLKILTFNLRTLYDTGDGINCFIHRAGMILEKIKAEQPQVICFQECSPKIREFLHDYLIGYDMAGHGRNADYSCESLCVAWKKKEMELFELEQFRLSPTPGLGVTFHDFGCTGKAEYARGRKIDYIFASPSAAEKVKSVAKWEDSKNGIYLSDHYPISCELEF